MLAGAGWKGVGGAVVSVVRSFVGVHELVRLLCACSFISCTFVYSARGHLYLFMREPQGFFWFI